MTYKLVRAKWTDSVAIAAWTTIGAPAEPDTVETVGYLVRDDEHYVTIAATVSEQEFIAAQQIPRKMLLAELEVLS